MDRRFFLAGLPLALAGCGAEAVWAPDDAIARAAYRHDGPPRLTLFTMTNVGSDNGAHSGLMINASQRVLFDPAGTFGHPTIPERNDVHFGITPQIAQYYVSYHSRITYYTRIQELDVSAELAQQAYRLALQAGPVAKTQCTVSTSRLMKQLPGFEDIRVTLFPGNLADQFGTYPGVRERFHHETDSDDKSIAAARIDAALEGRSE